MSTAKAKRKIPLRWVELTPEDMSKSGVSHLENIEHMHKYSRGDDGFPAVLVVKFKSLRQWNVYKMATFRTNRSKFARMQMFGLATQCLGAATLEDAKNEGAKWARRMTGWT